MKTLRSLALLALIASVARAYPLQADALPITHLTLRNGLVVIYAPDETASSVAVHVRYLAGASSDGGSGLTKLLERSLGAGSVHVKDFDARIDAVGGYTSTVTTHDYFAMTDHVPAHALELALWLEAERMAGLSDGLSREGVARGARAVQDEYRAAYVDQPYALVERELQRRLWNEERAVLGTGSFAAPEQLVAELREFARARMTPNNAMLVIAGRFDAVATRRLVEKYFGWIPRRQTIAKPAAVPIAPLKSAVSATVKDPLRKVVVAFRCEPFSHAIAIAAHVLAGGRSARLTRALVDSGLATDVHTELVRQRAGELRIVATPADGVDAARVVTAIHAELDKLRAQPLPADELARAAAMLETDLLIALENVAVRADLLATWTQYAGTTSIAVDWPSRLRADRPADLQRAFAQWLASSTSVTVIGDPNAESAP